MTIRRHDIDILRAISVLAVIFFHLDFSWAVGGYLGVDIFFVISGFLITRLILKDLAQGKFSYATFYARRMARLTPALLVTLLVTAFASVYVLPANESNALFLSAASASVYLSNFLFWTQSGYFDADSITKPLLHTWSLSIEEQFYIFWPLLLACIYRFRSGPILIAIGIISAIGATLAGPRFPDAVFFLLPFRVFEFVIGALVAIAPASYTLSRSRSTLACAVSMAAILFLLGTQAQDTTIVSELLVCLLAAGIILIRPAILNHRLFDPLNLIGLISYSAYLIHWPMIVFLQALTLGPIPPAQKASAVLATLALAFISWKYIEIPWQSRARNHNKRTLIIGGLSLAAFSFCFLLAFWWSPDIRQGTAIKAPEVPVQEYRRSFNQLERDILVKPIDGPRILFIGDSHSLDTLLSFWRTAPDQYNVGRINSPCHPLFITDPEAIESLYEANKRKDFSIAQCIQFHQSLYSTIQAEEPDLIVFGENWSREAVESLRASLQRLASMQVPLLVLGRNQTFQVPASRMIFGLTTAEEVNRRAWDMRKASLDDELRNAAYGVAFFASKEAIVCPAERSCDYVLNGATTYIDDDHWTWEGVDAFGVRMFEQPAVQEALKQARAHYELQRETR